MQTSLHRLALLGLLLALLPGLLLARGEHLRFCPHAWSGGRDCCVPVAEREVSSDCCASKTERDSLVNPGPCEDCCIDLEGPPNELSKPAPPTVLLTLAPAALAPRPAIHVHSTPPLRARTLSSTPATIAPPGRAPTPLRI